MSKFSFSFRRSERKAFKHIAHGLIPAATIAPRPAVPRTPPPRSPNPSPERPRSALAAAILSSSLTGRTVAIPPPRHRSYSESDCSHTDSQTGFEPYASTALYTRDQWPDSMAGRPRLPSPQPDDDDDDDDDDDEEEEIEDTERDESHVYQSVEIQSRDLDIDAVYATPLKQDFSCSQVDDDADNSAFDTVSPLNTEEETELEEGTAKKQPPSPLQARPPSCRSIASPDLNEDLSAQSPKSLTTSTPKRKTSMMKKSPSRGREQDSRTEVNEAYRSAVELQQKLVQELREHNQALCAGNEALERRCSEKSQQILQLQQQLMHSPRERSHSTGESSELLSLRQQAQELVDENDGLKMTVHRLNVELSRYQARFKPLTKEECSQSGGLPVKRPSPPWLLDMKYLSPLLLAYEDQLMERDKLLKSCEEEVKRLRVRSEEVIQENEKLHAELGKRSSVSNKEWRQLQDQARLVLEENQVLIEQLELQHTKAKETHTKHTQEVCKVSKQVMLLEAEKHALEAELETVRKELQTLKVEFQKTCTTLQNSVSWGEHNSTTDKLKRQMEEEERIKSAEIKELQACVNALQAEKRTLLVEKTNLSTDVKHLENELQLAHQANRKAQRRIDLLKQQVEDSLEKELVAHQYLTSVVTLAEKTTYERDQLMHMASCLEKDKQGVLTRIIEGTVRLGKLQEKVKVFKQQARAGVCALGRRLQEQEQDFAGKAATFQREIQHLQAQLRERQEQLHGALQQKSRE
ncbi:centrosomal protein of 89 kDa isoform X3 [Pygocentrus nattereri]|uniref:centrosomal protein of 89 kDa isoform X3 n=1 Tax=Pygocentrus nattereri TaxID=42514 RepID=UPI000814A0DB|nr:centrosomal protein of 89 kDa isoform X3 [Pygocentrus nattereri]